MFEKIKKYYDKGIYKAAHLAVLRDKGVITQEEFERIVSNGG